MIDCHSLGTAPSSPCPAYRRSTREARKNVRRNCHAFLPARRLNRWLVGAEIGCYCPPVGHARSNPSVPLHAPDAASAAAFADGSGADSLLHELLQLWASAAASVDGVRGIQRGVHCVAG